MPSNAFLRNLARFPVERPWVVLVSFAIAFAAAFHPLPRLEITQEDVNDLAKDDPEIVALDRFNSKFGDDEVVLVALESRDAFDAGSLRHLERLTADVQALPNVERVYSLFTIDDFESGEGGPLGTRFLKTTPDDPAVLASLKRRALANSFWTGFLVSKDGTIGTLTAVLRKIDGAVPHRAETAAKLRDLARAGAPQGMNVYVAGRGAMFLEADEAAHGDFLRYMWITPLWIAGILLYVFRSTRALVVSLMTCGLAVALTIALYLRAGNTAGMVFTMLPVQVAVICLSDILHVIARSHEDAIAGPTRREALIRTMEAMIPACFYTMATSAIGFLSFNAAGLQSLEVFGTWTAIGIAIAFVLSMTLVPALLTVLPSRRNTAAHYAPRVSGALIELSVWCLKLRRAGRIELALAWIVVLALSAFGLTRLEVDSDMASYLPEQSETARASRVLATKLAGTSTIEVMLEGPEYAFEEPWGIAALETVEQTLQADPRIDKTISVLDFLRRFSAALSGAEEVPKDGAALSAAFFVLDGSAEVDRFVTADRSTARVSARMNAHSSQGPVEIVEKIETLRASIDPRLTLTTTGISKIFAATSQALVTGQTRSLFFSLIWVSIALLIAVRSIRTGIIALLPNVAPILVTLGLMGWLGIPLDVFTVLIGSIALGIAVDDTIHLIARHKEERAVNPVGALERTLRSSGHPAIFTTFLFAGGFAVFLFSSFPPMRAFGALAAFAMITAMFADLTLLPLLLRTKEEAEDGAS